jgi:hypothetical protein
MKEKKKIIEKQTNKKRQQLNGHRDIDTYDKGDIIKQVLYFLPV